jgi:hypothetical protein
MSNINFSNFGRIIDRSIGLLLVGMGVILAGATAVAGV